MKAYVETYQEVEIKMSGKEASWLRAYVQNTLIDLETPEDAKNRRNLFLALSDAGVI